MKRIVLALTVSVLAISCKKEKVTPPEINHQSVIVVNEGNFPDGISTITLYDTLTGEVERDVYQKVNSAPVGSTVNDVLVDGDLSFFVVNGTGSVVVVRTEDFSLVKVFKNLRNIRHIAKAADNKYYISSWDLDAVYILDMTSQSISGSIQTGTGPSEMLLYKNWMFVANSGDYTSDSSISIINTQTNEVLTDFKVGENPNSLQIDSENRLWVLSSGIPDYTQPSNSTRASLHVFSLDSLEDRLLAQKPIPPQRVLYFDDVSFKPQYLAIDKSGEHLLFLDKGIEADVYRMSINSNALPSQPFITGSFYALGYEPSSHQIYLSNPLSYSEDGKVFRYSASDGALIDEFTSGLIPGSFGFR